MESRRRVIRVAVGLALTLAVLPLFGCGASSSSKATGSPAGAATKPLLPAGTAAAKA